jgi:hypothetical protein
MKHKKIMLMKLNIPPHYFKTNKTKIIIKMFFGINEHKLTIDEIAS